MRGQLIDFRLNVHESQYIVRMLVLLRKVRAAIEEKPQYLCNEIHFQGRGVDEAAMNLLVLWIAQQLEASVSFIDGEFKCWATLNDYMDGWHGDTWRTTTMHTSHALHLMRMAWCDKMIDTLEQKCIARGVELT